VSPEGQRRLAAALAHAPLAEEPFVVQGVLAIAKGDAERGLRLLEEAKRRNPRSGAARSLSARQAASGGRRGNLRA
jgi:hypothetical protein